MTLLNGNDLVAIVEIDRPDRDPSGRLKISRVFKERAN
jgi:hypothetical protein